MGKMDPWLSEFKEMIDLSVMLFNGQLECGSRIAVVLLDNCVEFMFKAFLKVKKRVVGTGKKRPIKPNEWESEVSRRFDRLADAMRKHSMLEHIFIDESEHYHTIRNNLYHTDTPMAVTSKIFGEQLKLVLTILERLYESRYSPNLRPDSVHEVEEIQPRMAEPADSVQEGHKESTEQILEADLERKIATVKKNNHHHWRRVDGEWRIVGDLERPDKVMVSLLSVYPDCKTIRTIAMETGTSIGYVHGILSGKVGHYASSFKKCQRGYKLSDSGVYNLLEEERIRELMLRFMNPDT